MVILVMSFKLMLLNKISLCDDCDKVILLLVNVQIIKEKVKHCVIKN